MPFTPDTFTLLEAIARTPSAAFYLAHKADFRRRVEEPLRAVMRAEADRLPTMMQERLETERNVFSRFLKNDFGRGGAWSHYWGAFYPRGSRRLADVQLAVWLDRRRLGISFYIGDYAAAARERFLRNVERFRPLLLGEDGPRPLLGGLLSDPGIRLPRGGETEVDEAGNFTAAHPLTWAEWLVEPKAGGFWAFRALRPDEVMQMPLEELAHLAARTHAALFPLALLAMEDEPLPLIRAFVEG